MRHPDGLNDREAPAIRTVFWPRRLRLPCLLYGFLNNDGSACVVGAIAEDTLRRPSTSLDSTAHACGSLRILGWSIGDKDKAKGRAEGDGPLHVTMQDGLPSQLDNTTLVLYDPPDPRQLRFLSAQPLQLDITTYALSSTAPRSSHPAKSTLSDLARDTFAADSGRPDAPKLDMERIVHQINASRNIRLATENKRSGHSGPKAISSLLHIGLFMKPLRSMLLLTLAALNYRIFGNNAIKDISATAHQLDVRVHQALSGPGQFRQSYKTEGPDQSLSRAHYISLYNTLWLVANDVIIGTAVCAFLSDNRVYLARQSQTLLKAYSVKGLQDTLLWLNDWPIGLKLNYELGKFFCDAFLWFTNVWEETVIDKLLVANLPVLIYLVGLSATLGTTMALSLSSDLLSLATFHLYAFYFMATAVFGFHTRAVGSLFNIFRGKKRNILRNRVEPSDYQLDQLLVGSILFTLAVFLFPTVLAYYLVFAASRCCIIAVHASLEAVLAFLNHFPLFAVMLRFKDPGRLPGGLRFQFRHCGGQAVLEMKNNPIPLSAIFHQYWALWASFSQHYSPIFVLGKLISGRYINAIPRSRLTFLERPSTLGGRDSNILN